MRSRIPILLKACITLLLFFLLFRTMDFRQFGDTIREAQWDVLFVAFLMLWTGHFICVLRWRMLMRPVMPVEPLPSLCSIYCIGLFFNFTFPTSVGGDVVKVYYAGKPSKLYSQSFAATFMDRDAGMLAMLSVACIAVIWNPVHLPRIPETFIVWAAFAFFAVVNLAVFTPPLHRLLSRMLIRHNLGSIGSRVDALSEAFGVLRRHPETLAGSFVISVANQLVVIAVVWFIAEGLRIQLPFTYFLILVPIITIVSMVPISINGMGLREFAFTSLFGTLGIPASSCIALGLLTSAMLVLAAVPGGIIYLFFKSRLDVDEIASMETDFP